MKTRTLLLLALGCGLAIMSAGAVFLLQLARQDDVPDPVAIGTTVRVGDMDVAVVDAVETSGLLDVRVRIGGVADADAAAGFRLIASGRPLGPLVASADAPDDACGPTTPDVIECHVRFDVSGADGRSRVLFYERGDDQERWALG